MEAGMVWPMLARLSHRTSVSPGAAQPLLVEVADVFCARLIRAR